VENEGIIALCDRFNMHECYRSTEWRIDPCAVDILPLMPAWERAQAQGVSIQTLPELQQGDPDWLPKLHQLYITLARDVPIPERATITAEQLAEFVGGLPISLPAACYVAIDAGRYIGVSFMHRSPDQPILLQKLTGVLAGHRGRGIALALKVATLQYARAQNFEQISTWIESNNPAMLNLSRKLGFVEQPGGIIVLEQKL
jgi:GNAT superfamily N-acetyltransferase